MSHVPQPQEEKLGYYFQSETCPGALETHDFLSFLWPVVCKWPVISVILIKLKIPIKKTRPIGYFPIVLMKLFELYMFQLDIYIYQLQTSVICTSALQSYLCYDFYEIADNNSKDCISK